MKTRLITGNEALAFGALRAGVKVVTGYPGTPSSGALDSLLRMEPDDSRHVECSINEKVAFEIAAGAAWAGQRALCTMKMSGLNVAYDSLISIAYSGVNGGLVIYVADDPGVSAGMAEQDSRGFAMMSDLPMLEPASVAETYRLVQMAFDLSEQVGTPVFVRLVASIANSHAPVDVDEPVGATLVVAPEREVKLERDITRYTKAGAAICKRQHRDLIARLEKAGQIIGEMGLNRLQLRRRSGDLAEQRSGDLAEQRSGDLAEQRSGDLAEQRSGDLAERGLGVVASGAATAYLEEGFEIAAQFGCQRDEISVLRVVATNPFPAEEVRALLRHCDTVLVLEELEPYLERNIHLEARQIGFEGRIIGKLDGFFSRIGEYGVEHVVRGIGEALGLEETGFFPKNPVSGIAEQLAAARPITVCAGCPHRGTYMAINQAIKGLGLKKDEVMVTGDIGCTILGMNPPFHTVWTEVAMGASLGIAQGYVHAGVETPVIATIGDSTFFHAGVNGLINAIQHQAPLTLIIMDNGWTSMTGMQVNPGTDVGFQRPGDRRVDIASLIPALGVEHFFIIDPFELDESVATIQKALTLPGVKVVLSRQECAIQAQRRGLRAGNVQVIPENCTLCKQCITITGCPVISIGEDTILIDPNLCYGCGLCAQVCKFEAIVRESVT